MQAQSLASALQLDEHDDKHASDAAELVSRLSSRTQEVQQLKDEIQAVQKRAEARAAQDADIIKQLKDKHAYTYGKYRQLRRQQEEVRAAHRNRWHGKCASASANGLWTSLKSGLLCVARTTHYADCMQAAKEQHEDLSKVNDWIAVHSKASNDKVRAWSSKFEEAQKRFADWNSQEYAEELHKLQVRRSCASSTVCRYADATCLAQLCLTTSIRSQEALHSVCMHH